MKRPRRAGFASIASLLFALLLSAPALPTAASPKEALLSWMNDLRRAAGAPAVMEDARLSETARDWARALAAAGRISHRGADGSTARDRYRAHGGTEVRVGEILGAGPELSDVEKAWERSASHRSLACRHYWTHAGWGSAETGSPGATHQVWVVLFCQEQVADLKVSEEGRRLLVSGRFVPSEADGALMLVGIDPVSPGRWDPETREFDFSLQADGIPGYLRLGYVDAAARFVLTNALTLPRGTGSPEGKYRSSEPAASP